jgi:CRISPR-associated protein Cmr6
MTFADALRKAQKKAEKKGKQVKLDIPSQESHEYHNPEQVPRMYRAQVEGRCSLQFAGEGNQDLRNWVVEWVDPISERNPQPRYQRQEPPLGWDGSVYRLKVQFPWRVCSNCGADSILRPVIGKDGIPFFPGSGIKGLFRRLLNSEQLDASAKQEIAAYCGSQDHRGKLRFHGAYPVGDWAGTQMVTNQRTGSVEARYRMSDVLHPQQPRQVQGKGRASAFSLITLFQPTLIFELSSPESYSEEDWNYIGGLLRRALSQGLGGKTSTGYGLWVIPKAYALQYGLQGVGVSSLLRNDEPEFRLNMFKASLRGHATRLIAGVSGDPDVVKEHVNKLFGHTRSPGIVQHYWEWRPENLEITQQGREKTPVFQVEGNLYLDIDRSQVLGTGEYQKHLDFLKSLFEFTYVMGGIGKSWRRAWHKGPEGWEDEFQSFFPSYETRAIGCHWQSKSNFELREIQSQRDLSSFLTRLHQDVQRYCSQSKPQYVRNWRESWNPQRVAVFCSKGPVSQSEVIHLFHDDEFKTTPAIGGKSPRDTRPTSFSHVWHRMLPVGESASGRLEYLEIVTLFHGDTRPWQRDGEDQLQPFIDHLARHSMTLAWGKMPR